MRKFFILIILAAVVSFAGVVYWFNRPQPVLETKFVQDARFRVDNPI